MRRRLAWAALALLWIAAAKASAGESSRLPAAPPGDVATLREAALGALWAGRYPEAIALFEDVLAAEPADDETRLQLGRALWWSGRTAEAVGPFAMALGSLSGDPAVVAEAVPVFVAAGRRPLGERWLANGLRAHPGQPDLRVARAALWRDDGEVERAEAELEAVLRDHPDHGLARERLAELRSEGTVERAERLGWAGRYGEARRLLREHRQQHPEDERAARTLARFAAWGGRYAEAQDLYRELLVTKPGDRELRTELAEVTSWRGQSGEALRLFEDLVAEDTGDLRARVGAANVYLWAGVHREADRRLREILALDPSYEPAQAQLANLARQRAPALRPAVSWFGDSEDLSLWTPETELSVSPRPGRTLHVRLDAPFASGEHLLGFDPATGEARFETERTRGLGLVAGFSERPGRAFAFGADVGAAQWDQGGASPRLRLHGTWYPDFRHAFELELRHEDAFPDVRSIASALEGVERSAAGLVHSYQGERLDSWTRLELGRYSDDPDYWSAQTSLGFALIDRPFELDLIGGGIVGDFGEVSPFYYSPQDLQAVSGGLRVKRRLWKSVDLVLIAERGKLEADGFRSDTEHLAPSLVWEIDERSEFSLRWDRYESARRGQAYESDLVGLWLRHRLAPRGARAKAPRP